jgi:hypothetical protein
MRMALRRVVSIRVFSPVDEHPDDLGLTVLSGERQGTVPILCTRRRKALSSDFRPSYRSGDREIDVRASPQQRDDRLGFVVSERGQNRWIRVGSAIAEQVDEWNLYAAFAWHFSRTDQPKHRVDAAFVCAGAGIEDDLDDVDDVRRQSSMANGVLRCKFQQRRIADVACGLETDPLTNDIRMACEMRAQPIDITRVEQVDCSTKCRGVDLLVHG